MIISDELLSAVLGIEASEASLEKRKMVEYINWSNNGAGQAINLYELAHLCKKWAIKQGYFIWTGYEGRVDLSPQYSSAVIGRGSFHHEVESLKLHTMFHSTEPGAIFRSCEWILKRIEDENL